MTNFKNNIFVLIIVVLIFAIVSMGEKKNAEVSKKPKIAVSTFALYDITKNIVGDKADIVMILPFGVDAHSYEPTPKQTAQIYSSDLVVYSGAGLEPWCKNFVFKNKVIDMSKFVKLISLDKSTHHDHHHKHSDHTADPHYWLDINNMLIATDVIYKAVVELLPQYTKYFEENKNHYKTMLVKLDEEYKSALDSCKKDTIVVNHNAYSYLAKNYGFHVESLAGFSPQAQANAKNMVKILKDIKLHDIDTVFYESFASDKYIKSVAKEAGVNVKSLQPLGNITAAEAKNKLSYKDIMKQNLEKISDAMGCR